MIHFPAPFLEPMLDDTMGELGFESYVYTNFNWELKKPSLRPRVAKGGRNFGEREGGMRPSAEAEAVSARKAASSASSTTTSTRR